MGCGVSTDTARAVLHNLVTLNGRKTKPEKFDFDLDDPELDQAASKIQAAFRGHKAKKEEKTNPSKDKGSKAKSKKMSQEEVVDIDLNDPEVGKAATKIQASFRGHKTRKNLKEGGEKPEGELTEEGEKAGGEEEEGGEEEGGGEATSGETAEGGGGSMDVDPNDPDANKAATKIQAQYRGHAVRRGASVNKSVDVAESSVAE